MASNNPRPNRQLDLSGGCQIGTSHLLRKSNEVKLTKNAIYNAKIGSAKRRDGYERVAVVGNGTDTYGGFVYRYGSNDKVIVGSNNSDGTTGTLRYLDSNGGLTTIISDAPASCRFQMLNDLDELYVAGASANNNYLALTNIDYTLTASTTRNVYKAPASKFIAEYNGELYAINCYVNGKYYHDRFYKSSPPLGFITQVQTDQAGLLQNIRVDSVRYIKAGMQLDIYSSGTEARLVTGLTVVSVDKKNNRFSFEMATLNVKDNDEIWLSGTKGKLSRFWNADYKTPETADWERVPPGREAKPEFTGWGKNNNRLFLFTKNSFLKWDGANLITVSETIGCVSHETIQNIGSWTIWLHTTGVWAYNDNTGQLQLLSRAIDPYIRAINQTNFPKASAVAVGRVYKVAVGELLPLESVTTSTSTSSTSTSSTSSSTSSTSTSSTSTSTSSFTTITTSTSSTSVSTTSSSTSSTSTSTTTAVSTKKVYRLCYDFDLNAWWTEEHKREFRFQFNHTMHGYTKPYFTDELGNLFRDETTNRDHVDPIPMEVQLGRNNFGTDQTKRYLSVLVDSENARGAQLQYSIDGGAFRTLGQVNKNVEKLLFPTGGEIIEGRDIDFKFVHNEVGDPGVWNGVTTWWTLAEVMVNG